MQKFKSQQILKLASQLKKQIKGNVIDIFVIGSSLKDKLEPRDLDLIVFFKEKNLKEVEEELYAIKESLNIANLHIEPIFASSLFEEKITLSIMHEGFSIKKSAFISDTFNLKSYSIFSYSLENQSKINKVRFAQTLYGRKKDGILYTESGISLGHGSFMAPVLKEEIFKELMKKWKVKYNLKRAFVND